MTEKLARAWFSSWHGGWVGALVGGVVGCLSRPAVVAAFWLSVIPESGALQILFVSCVIGGLIGASAGAFGGAIPSPIAGGFSGAIIGGIIALFSTIFTIPLFFLCFLCLPNEVPHRPRNDLDPYLYLTLMTITGIVPGALGGLAGSLLRDARGYAAIKTDGENKEETAPPPVAGQAHDADAERGEQRS